MYDNIFIFDLFDMVDLYLCKLYNWLFVLMCINYEYICKILFLMFFRFKNKYINYIKRKIINLIDVV